MELTPEDRRRRDLVVLRSRMRRHARERATVTTRSALLRAAGQPRRT